MMAPEGRALARASMCPGGWTGIQDVWMDMMHLVDREDGCLILVLVDGTCGIYME
jgi:hypothetical protein